MSEEPEAVAQEEVEGELAPYLRRIRSFVRREGRLTTAQSDALERLWPQMGLDVEPGQHRYDWAAVFGRVAPVSFEIGFGNGDHLLSRAKSEPERNFVGVEVHRPGVGRLLHHAEKEGLSNLRAICHDAVEVLEQAVPDASLDEVIVYFPDPWHKKRHNKRRLVQPEFAALVISKLAPGGLWRLATDWEPYAQHMLEVLEAAPGLENTAGPGKFSDRIESRPKTRFEARGERLGHEVFDLVYRRKD